LHDPESSVNEKAAALRMGRLRKIQIIDGRQVEVLQGEIKHKIKHIYTVLS